MLCLKKGKMNCNRLKKNFCQASCKKGLIDGIVGHKRNVVGLTVPWEVKSKNASENKEKLKWI